MHDVEKALQPKTRTDPATMLAPEYHDYLVFSQTEADKFPPHRDADHNVLCVLPNYLRAHLRTLPIHTHPSTHIHGKVPPYVPLYSMSQDELKVLRDF